MMDGGLGGPHCNLIQPVLYTTHKIITYTPPSSLAASVSLRLSALDCQFCKMCG